MKCDFCNNQPIYDAKTIYGPWAWLCKSCFKNYGIGLGLGKGQKIEFKTKSALGEKNAN